MAIDTETRASRRNILAAALGGLGGLLAGRLGNPERTAAAQDDPVTVGGFFQGTGVTSFENTDPGESSLRGFHATDGKAVEAATLGWGYGLYATAPVQGGRAAYASSLDKAGVTGHSTTVTPNHLQLPSENVGVLGAAGDITDIATDVSETGVYGFCDTSPAYAAGVWGDTVNGVGVVGTGDWGVFGAGNVAFKAVGAIALHTTGKVVFSGRSGHNYVRAGHYYVDIPISGMTAAADVIATLRTRKSGYYINAVTSYTGKFRLFLNKTTYSNLHFNFLVLNG